MRRLPIVVLTALALGGTATAADSDLAAKLNSNRVELGGIETDFGLFVARSDAPWGKSGRSRIVQIDPVSGETRTPGFATPRFSDSDPFYDETNGRLCFVSTRPVDGSGVENEPGDIWCTRRIDGEWTEPRPMPHPVNSPAREYSPVFDDAGTLYFASDREGGFGQGDIYRATPTAGGDWRVENMGKAVNSQYGEWNVGINAAGTAIIVEASSRPTNRTIPGDLYFSELVGDRWTAAVPLSTLNSDSSDLMARWVGRERIMFASARVGDGDVDHFTADENEWRPVAPTLSVVSRSSGEVVLLDPQTLAERGRIALGTGPHELAASLDGRVAVAPLLGIFPEPHEEPVSARPPFIERPSDGVAVVDLKSGAVKRMALNDCLRPHGVAADAQGARFWVTCESEGAIVELDPDGWRETRRFPLPVGVHKVHFDQARRALFASSPESGTFHKLDLETEASIALHTGPGAESFTLSEDGQTAWVANSHVPSICNIDTRRMETRWCVDAGGSFPIALALVSRKNELWVSRLFSSDIAVFLADTGKYVGDIGLPTGALDLEVDMHDRLVYATLPRHNRVVAIDADTRTVVASFDDVMEGDDLDLIR